MDIRKLQRAIVDGLEDVKAQNIEVFNTEHLSPLFERVIIASGTSNRQTKALASSVREAVKLRGMQVLRTEGEANGEWIIVDCGAAVAHIMQPAIRDYYHLEEIWGGKAVRMKMGEPSSAGRDAAHATRAPARFDKSARAAKSSRGAPAKVSEKAGAAKKPAGARLSARMAAGKSAQSGSRESASPRKAVVRTVGVKSAASAAKSKPARKTSRRG